MKNYFKVSSFIMLLVVLLAGCKKDFLDINDDPNNPSDAPVSLVLPAAQNSLATVVGGEFFNLGSLWAQYFTQSPFANQYKTVDGYSISTDYLDALWQESYSGALNDFEDVKNRGNNSYKLIATVSQAYLYQVLADAVDKIPYSEALKGREGLTQPKFDDGEVVYDGLLAMIDAALAAYEADPTGNIPSNADFIYNGDINQWIKFANTLKLKIYMRISNTSKANPQAVTALLNEGNFLTADAKFGPYLNENNKRNPWFDTNTSFLGGSNHKASNTLLLLLQSKNDPRVTDIYIPGIGAGSTLTGLEQGNFNDVSSVLEVNIARPNYSAVEPVFLLTVYESNFLQAEAAVKYGTGDAQSLYEAGIDANFDTRGLTPEPTLYQAGGVYEFPAAGTQEDKLKAIYLQKWISMAMLQNYEAMTEIRRTGYPEYATDSTQIGKLLISIESQLPAGQVPNRVWFPDISVSRNKNTPPQPSSLNEKIWWAK